MLLSDIRAEQKEQKMHEHLRKVFAARIKVHVVFLDF